MGSPSRCSLLYGPAVVVVSYSYFPQHILRLAMMMATAMVLVVGAAGLIISWFDYLMTVTYNARSVEVDELHANIQTTTKTGYFHGD